MTTSASQTAGSLHGPSRHFSGISLNGPLAMSLVAASLVGLVALVGCASLVSAVFRGSIHDDQPKAVIDDLVAKHDVKFDEYQERFVKRYVFFKPPPPPPPPRVVRDEPPPPPPPPVDTGPTIPTVYQGPSIAWVIGDDVYFSMVTPTQTEKYFRVGVNEERNGLKVLSTEKMPQTVRVAHMGGEYDVKVFGDAMNSKSLFPTSSTDAPRPSITIPGFVPVRDAAAGPIDEAASTAAGTQGDVPDSDVIVEGDGDEEMDEVTPAPTPSETAQRREGAGERRGRGAPRGERPRRPDGSLTIMQSTSGSFVDRFESLSPTSHT